MHILLAPVFMILLIYLKRSKINLKKPNTQLAYVKVYELSWYPADVHYHKFQYFFCFGLYYHRLTTSLSRFCAAVTIIALRKEVMFFKAEAVKAALVSWWEDLQVFT